MQLFEKPYVGYPKVVPAGFLRRPNRFIAEVELEGKTETVHVKNTGRCKELLLPGARVYLAEGAKPGRKTRYDLVAVEKCREGNAPLLINMDAQLPNDLVAAWLPVSGLCSSEATIRREVSFGASRFDFYIEDGDRKIYLEVKGVTLEESGIVRFPDAPTERGVKHLQELMAAKRMGYEAWLLFVVQMALEEGMYFEPNDRTHPAFGQTLREAAKAGVRIMAYCCHTAPDRLSIARPIKVRLS